jgi:hypothetical protein
MTVTSRRSGTGAPSTSGTASIRFPTACPPIIETKLDHLLGLANAWDVHVATAPLSGTRYGEYYAGLNEILLNEKMHGYQAVDCLAHELTHAFHRDVGTIPEQEDRANRGAIALVLDEATYQRAFDPRRHLYRSPEQNRTEAIQIFGCGFQVLRWRHAQDADCGEHWCVAHRTRRVAA